MHEENGVSTQTVLLVMASSFPQLHVKIAASVKLGVGTDRISSGGYTPQTKCFQKKPSLTGEVKLDVLRLGVVVYVSLVTSHLKGDYLIKRFLNI